MFHKPFVAYDSVSFEGVLLIARSTFCTSVVQHPLLPGSLRKAMTDCSLTVYFY